MNQLKFSCLGPDHLATLARNSFLGAFLPEPEIAAHVAAVDAYFEAFEGTSSGGRPRPDPIAI